MPRIQNSNCKVVVKIRKSRNSSATYHVTNCKTQFTNTVSTIYTRGVYSLLLLSFSFFLCLAVLFNFILFFSLNSRGWNTSGAKSICSVVKFTYIH